MAAELFLLPFRPALDLNAVPVPGASLYFYASGTTTPQAVYADEDLTVSLGYIVEADAAGAWPNIYLDSAKIYRVEMKDANGVTLPNSGVDPYIPGVVDALAPEIAADAADARASAFVLSAINGGYWETSLTPPSDAEVGQDFYFSFNGRAGLATNDGSGDGTIRFELATDAKMAETYGPALALTNNFSISSGVVKSQSPFSYGMDGVLQSLWGGGFENNTRHFIGNPIGRAALVGFTRSSDNPTVGDMGTYAIGAFTEHNSDKYAWSGYDEIRRRSAAGAAHGREIAIINFGSTVDVDPYNPYAANMTDGLRLSAGRTDTPGQTDISAFLSVVSVGGAKALRGINFGTGSLVTTGGQSDALNLGTNMAIQWWAAAGQRGPRIRSDATTPAQSMGLVFANNIVAFQNPSFSNVFTVEPTRVKAAVPIQTAIYTIATLPTGQLGDRAFVTDATGGAFGSAVSGGGSSALPVFFNGTAWCIG